MKKIFFIIVLIFTLNCFQKIYLIEKSPPSIKDTVFMSIRKKIVSLTADGLSYSTVTEMADNIDMISISPDNRKIVFYTYSGELICRPVDNYLSGGAVGFYRDDVEMISYLKRDAEQPVC